MCAPRAGGLAALFAPGTQAMHASSALRQQIVATALRMNALRHQPRQVGQRQRALRRSTAFWSRRPACRTRRPTPDDIVAMTLDGTASGRAAAVVRMALPPRHLRGAARRRRDRAHACAVRDDARLPRARHSRLPLHGRGGRRQATSAARRTRRSARRRLSDHALVGAGRRASACLLANHGMIAVGALARRRARARRRSRNAGRNVLARACRRGRRICCPTPRWRSCWRNSAAMASRSAAGCMSTRDRH